jgi:UDP-N-acetyl-D-glucosamine dehydrogenase
MPDYVIAKVTEALNDHGKSVRGSKVLILGIAYKADVDDDRESPSYVLFEKLQALGANVSYYDPYVPVIRPSREHGHLAGIRSVRWDQDTVSGFDLVLISTAHKDVNYAELMNWANLVVDTRNAMGALAASSSKVYRA